MPKGKDMTQITSQLRFQAHTVLNKRNKDSEEVCNWESDAMHKLSLNEHLYSWKNENKHDNRASQTTN